MQGRSAARVALISGAVMGFLACATFLVLLLGTVLPLGFVGDGIDDRRGARQDAAISAVAEMHQRRQGGMGTYRVTVWRVTSVKKCRSDRPRAYAVEVDLFTLFGIPYGETGVSCRSPEPANKIQGPF